MHSRSAIGWRSVEVVWELFDTPTYLPKGVHLPALVYSLPFLLLQADRLR